MSQIDSDPANQTLSSQCGVTTKTRNNTLVVRPENLPAMLASPCAAGRANQQIHSLLNQPCQGGLMHISDRSAAFPLISRRPLTRRKNVNSQTISHWFEPLKNLKQIFAGMTLMSSSAASTHAASPTGKPFSALLDVTPSIAAANTPRLLTITAYFPLGCGPTDATLASVTTDGARSLEVRLDTPSTDFAACALVLVPYTVEISYTPTEVGDLPVRIMSRDGVLAGESVVVTRASKGDDAQFAVTGKWIDPAMKETGLALTADSPRNDAVVGTWNFHDYQGVSRRYSIQSVHWNEPDVEAEGAIFETTASAAIAPSIDLPQASAHQLGLARITFHGRDCARIFALGFGGNVLFTSNLIRSTL